VRAAARPPTHANTASDRHRRERILCLDRPAPGTPSSRIPGHASGRHRGGNGIAGNALGRCRGPRMRPSSRPTALKRNALGRHPRPRPRAPARPAGQRVPPTWCRPTSACSPTPLRVDEIGAILAHRLGTHAIPIYHGGAADAQLVGRARAAHWIGDQRPIQPRDCCGPTANPYESGIRAPSRGTHPLPGKAVAGSALGRHPRHGIRPPL
jgi:hypothetical protein